MGWSGATREHQTFCISCHTALPYALARPALRTVLGESAPSPLENKLVDSVRTRVRLWKEIEPYYTDRSGGPNKTAESRGTEAVLNALILVTHEASSGMLSSDARTALDDMWAAQHVSGATSGAWSWLQFNNEPWEGHDSMYYGAALAAVAVASTPTDYRHASPIRGHVQRLQEYLVREFRSQSPINHVVLLWASIKWPELLSPEQKITIVREIERTQCADGGWRLSSLSWTWNDWTMLSLAKMLRAGVLERTDPYATGLITLVLTLLARPDDSSRLARARSWLATNQDKETGAWPGYSLNTRHHASSQTALFMTDAATAYAVLALTQSEARTSP